MYHVLKIYDSQGLRVLCTEAEKWPRVELSIGIN